MPNLAFRKGTFLTKISSALLILIFRVFPDFENLSKIHPFQAISLVMIILSFLLGLFITH